MARSARRTSPTGTTPSVKKIFTAGPLSWLIALSVAVLGLALVLILALSASARTWGMESLGFGWIPVAIWAGAATLTLRFRPKALLAHWKWWVGLAGLATVSISLLSLFHPGDGMAAKVSLSGRWGSILGGEPIALAGLKVAGLCALVPLLMFPRAVAKNYWLCLRSLALGVRLGSIYLYLAISHTANFLGRWIGAALYHSYQHGLLAKLRSAVRQRTRAPETGADQVGVGLSGQEAEVDLWGNFETGAIPPLEAVKEAQAATTTPSPSDAVSWDTRGSRWHLPTMDLLSPPDAHATPEASLIQMGHLVESTLADHGVAVEVKDIKAGPRIVRFGLVPGWLIKRSEANREDTSDSKQERSRVKVQSILIREKDLALALKTPFLRLEAPVPGEALVGLEVPSPSPSKVHLREVMQTPVFAGIANKGGLPIALGQDTAGDPVVTDLQELPHVLIAGATGSGKSVCINSIVASLLLTQPPDQLRLLMVDPKRVELTPFNGIPHLITPVIVDTDEVNTALRGLMREMMRRYKLMEDVGARNITGYNSKAADRLPYLVLIVDELADLMIVGGFEVEQNLVRLAQLGRATGIHLVLATQRPSVNVVTGLLKANVPARVAFSVAAQVDSRVILDTVGAEKLLGKGDMLLLHNESPKPRRVQGTLVYDTEIDQLVDFWANQKGPPLPEISMGDPGSGEDDDEEPADQRLLHEARDLAIRNPQISSSHLERRLKIGGRRAAQIMDTLEEEGLVVGR